MANEFVQTMADARVDARSLSEFVFRPAGFTVQRRLAPSINTLEYYINKIDGVATNAASEVSQAINNAILSSGIVIVDSFELGATITKRNEALRHTATGKLYRWGGSLPKTVAASSTPENSGGFGSDAWLEVSDSSLRYELTTVGGASSIKNGVSVFNTLADFLVAEPSIKSGTSVHVVQMYQGGDLEGEGRTYEYTKTGHKDVYLQTASGYLSRAYDGKIFYAELGGQPTWGEYNRAAMNLAFELLRNNGGGIFSMGNKCEYEIAGNYIAEISDTEWQFNQTTVNLLPGSIFIVRWYPNALGYGDYKNVTIKDAIIMGDSSQVVSSSTTTDFALEVSHMDNLRILNCKFYEVVHYGHIVDLIACRDFHFYDNEVYGSCNPPSNRLYTECIQIDKSYLAGYGGGSVPADRQQFVDGRNTRDVYIKRNIFTEYENPKSGIVTYVPRPFGNHGFYYGENIVFEDNYVKNVVVQEFSTTAYRNAIFTLPSHPRLEFNRNTIISNNGNFSLFDLTIDPSDVSNESTGINIRDNRIFMENLGAAEKSGGTFNMMTVRGGVTDDSYTGVYPISIERNRIRYDAVNEFGIFINLIYFQNKTPRTDIRIDNNDILTRGTYQTLHNSTSTRTTMGKFSFSGNIIDTDDEAFTIDLRVGLEAIPARAADKVLFVVGNKFINSNSMKIHTKGSLVFKDNEFVGDAEVSADNPRYSALVTNAHFLWLIANKGVAVDGNVLLDVTRPRFLMVNSTSFVDREDATKPDSGVKVINPA